MSDNLSVASVEEHADKTVISVTIPKTPNDFILHIAPDTELARANRKRILEYNDRYGEPLVPGGVMSVAQEEGDEEIPLPAGEVVSPAGAINLAVEQYRLNERITALEQERVLVAPQEIKDRLASPKGGAHAGE